MAINLNADIYAANRMSLFFPGFPAELTGQCVSLAKWYIGEMCGVADWQSARGNAKDFGDTLVNQGLAVIVDISNRRRGDLVVWKQDGGGYGHIGVLLSGDMVFEENAGIRGTPTAVYGGITVYASRTDPLGASWRLGAPTFYRMNGYSEVDPNLATRDQVIADYLEILYRDPSGVDEGGISHYMKYSNAAVRADLFASDERKIVVAAQAAAAAAAAQAQIDADNAAQAAADKAAADAAAAQAKATQDAIDAQKLADAQLADAKARADAAALQTGPIYPLANQVAKLTIQNILTWLYNFFKQVIGAK
jgi:hypothetical protein